MCGCVRALVCVGCVCVCVCVRVCASNHARVCASVRKYVRACVSENVGLRAFDRPHLHSNTVCVGCVCVSRVCVDVRA